MFNIICVHQRPSEAKSLGVGLPPLNRLRPHSGVPRLRRPLPRAHPPRSPRRERLRSPSWVGREESRAGANNKSKQENHIKKPDNQTFVKKSHAGASRSKTRFEESAESSCTLKTAEHKTERGLRPEEPPLPAYDRTCSTCVRAPARARMRARAGRATCDRRTPSGARSYRLRSMNPDFRGFDSNI